VRETSAEKERMLAGEPYDSFDPLLVRERERARDLVRRFGDAPAADANTRQEILDELLGSMGENATIKPPFRCDYGFNIRIGNGFYANFDCVILDICPVTFGDGCLLGPGVHLYTAAHPTAAARRREGVE
jgi:maltose O-acetyltransferase